MTLRKVKRRSLCTTLVHVRNGAIALPLVAVALGLCADGCGVGTFASNERKSSDHGTLAPSSLLCPRPSEEVCDGLDNDCDGHIDEGVLNPCGHCEESCFATTIEAADRGAMDQGATIIAATDPDNVTGRPGITLTMTSDLRPYLWAANHVHNTVTKFNTDTNEEEGIYWVGYNPSRTAVDLDGNCWVGGRDDGRLTKILVNTDTCTDRDGDGSVRTSGLDGAAVTVLNGENNPLGDDCVAYSDVPNPSRTSIRGLAVAPDGKMWIGYSGGGIQSIDPVTFELGTFHDGQQVPLWVEGNDGALVETGSMVSASGVYGLVIDAGGLLYASSYNRALLPCFDTVAEQWIAAYQRRASCSYGIAVDSERRVWTGGWPGCAGVNMFDPRDKRFRTFAVPQSATAGPGSTSVVELLAGGAAGGKDSFTSTGVAAEPATGDIWVSFHAVGYTGRLRVNAVDLAESRWTFIGTTVDGTGAYLPDTGADLRGVGFDHMGFAWTLGLGSDKVFKLDPATNDRAASLPEGKSIGVGTHYTYSDFTGSTAFNFTAPRGTWRDVVESPFQCASPTMIIWDVHLPDTTTVQARVRILDEQGVPVSDWVPASDTQMGGYFTLVTGDGPQTLDLTDHAEQVSNGHYLEIEAVLRTTGELLRPILHRLEVQWQRDWSYGACQPA